MIIQQEAFLLYDVAFARPAAAKIREAKCRRVRPAPGPLTSRH